MDIPHRLATLEEVQELTDWIEPIAFDTETDGFYGKVCVAQFYQAHWDEVLLVHNPDPLLLAVYLDKVLFVAHNAHYDISTIQRQTGSRWIPKAYDCTLLLSRLKFYNKPEFNADAVMEYTLGFDPYKQCGIDKKVMQKSKWNTLALTKDQKLYAAIDVYYLIDVYNACKAHAEDTSYRLDKLTLNYCLDFQNNGMPVINDELQNQYSSNLAKIEEYNMPINVNSYKQVRPYIGSDQSNDLGLAKLSLAGNEKAKAVRAVRKIIKQNSFLNKFDTIEQIIYGLFAPLARSGRLTSKDQNLQQLPRKLKHLFGYHTEDGRVLIYADYAQLEMRTITVITGELRMAGLLREGEDLHDYTARMLFGEGFTKKQRQIAKTANFGLLYGAGVNVFLSILITDADLLLSEAEGSAVKRKWGNLWHSVIKWQEQGKSAWRHGSPWATPFGRRYTAKMMTDQLNIQNQGFGAEVAKLALHYMYPKIKEKFGDDVLLHNFIHDSYIFSCENDPAIYEPIAEIVATAMQEAWFEALRTGNDLQIRDLPMPVEVFVGYNWGKIEDDYLYKYELEGMATYA